MKMASKEDVLKLYEQLLPWEQEDVKAEIGVDLGSWSEEDILHRFGIDPVDHVTAKECYETLGDSIIDHYSTYELLDEISNRIFKVDPSDIIDILVKKARFKKEKDKLGLSWFSEEDIESLENLIRKIKEELNTEEVLGTTVVIRDDDGDIQDGTYESWLTFYNTEFNLSDRTNFKEGDKVEIFARKVK